MARKRHKGVSDGQGGPREKKSAAGATDIVIQAPWQRGTRRIPKLRPLLEEFYSSTDIGSTRITDQNKFYIIP